MPSRAEIAKTELIEHIAESAGNRIDDERVDLTVRFIRGLYANVPPNDLTQERPESLYGAAISLLRFAEQRPANQPKLRVYSPRLDQHGWQAGHTVVEIINDDMPFLVDSVTMELNRSDANVRLVIHPVFAVQRDAQGHLRDLRLWSADASSGTAESFMHIKLRAQSAEDQTRIQESLTRILTDVRIAVNDFDAMRAKYESLVDQLRKAPPPVPPVEIETATSFLDWINDNNFTHLGYRHYELEAGAQGQARLRPEPGLGLLRDPDREVVERFQPVAGDYLRIFKANARSTVHRPVHMDVVALPDYQDGQLVGEHVLVGLFTLAAYSRSPENIPVLREKIRRILDRSGFPPHSHNGKSLRYILETYPRDELFQITEDELLAIAKGILYLQRRQRVALFVRHDPFDRFVSCLVYVPRDRFDTALRVRLQNILVTAFHGSLTAYYTFLGDEPLARLHIIIKTPQGTPANIDLPAIEQKLFLATRSWQDRLHEALLNEHGEERGSRLARRYANAFPAGYREAFDELAAVHDLAFVEQALESDQLRMNLYRPIEASSHELHFKIYSPRRYVPLSDVMPMLENMGVRVIVEIPYDIRPLRAGEHDHRQTIWLHDFIVETENAAPVELAQVKPEFQETFSRVLRGEMDNDGFNRLVLHAGLTLRDIRMFRAYAKYLRQLQSPFSEAYMQHALIRNPGIARLMAIYFRARFEPDRARDDLPAIAERLHTELDAVVSLDEDRILRRFMNLIDATVRTNFYQTDSAGEYKPHEAFKLDCSKIEEIPAPCPYREIFVFSPRVEGVHLRFGKVARGGLRWSDRLEDFRTETLGLVKAQQVKNAVIVPVGSKGGFVVKRAPAESGREAVLAEGIACYQTFIGGLLDLTDNLTANGVVPPAQVVRYDGPDSYLVVAADKGTATFSDLANEVARSRAFWLDDAFASGGSAGYDHKKMGITARGAWESVKRHFRELGKDIQTQDFTCIGVGDMSGDVFGNGMLLSRHIRLVAAFNHLHIFVDPDPDPEVSWHERQRLFQLSRSTWKDYSPDLVSKGGGVFERSLKTITTTPEMRELLDLNKSRVTPNELIRAILSARTDLLWLGGIGTYVKGRDESHADAGDRANDVVRVEADAVRAQVVGEGANLGFTQQARVEFALGGGRINTDFIDNSGGVDCSDREVNIKILLGETEREGDLTRKHRDQLLREMTDEVAELVLRNNYLQSQAISVSQRLGSHILDRLSRFMQALEKTGKLDRALEGLPDTDELVERHRVGASFTRPELAVLLAYAKRDLYEELVESDLPDVAYLTRDLLQYFPTPLRTRYSEPIHRHRLRREIVATVVTNDIVNRMGITFAQETCERTGAALSQVALAYVAAREILAVPVLWNEIEALDNRVRANAQYAMLLECARFVDRIAVWLIREHGPALDIEALHALYADGVAQLGKHLDEVISESDRASVNERTETYCEEHVPEELARRIAGLPLLAIAGDIVVIAKRLGIPVLDVARVYFEVGHRFGFEWLRRTAMHLPTDRAWDKQAVGAVVDDLAATQRELTSQVLRQTAREAAAISAVDVWAEPRRSLIMRNQQVLAELEAVPAPDFAMLAVANRHLKGLVTESV